MLHAAPRWNFFDAFSAQSYQVSLACCQQQTVTLATGKLIRRRRTLFYSRVTVTCTRNTAVANLNNDRPPPEISEDIFTHFFLRLSFFLVCRCASTSFILRGCSYDCLQLYTHQLSDGMSRVNYTLPYTRPVGASDEDASRARTLLGLRRSALTKTEREDGVVKDTLCDLLAKYDKGQRRFTPPARKKNLQR